MSDKKRKFILSDSQSINSHGFRVHIEGGDLARFMVNPVMLYEHNIERVIGKWVDIERVNGKLLATPVFDTDDDEAAKIAGKVERGFLNGASIGIRILKLEVIDDEYVATEWELLEVSIVSIPSDAGAVRLYNEKRECLSFDAIKLSMNKNKRLTEDGKTDFKAMYAEICEALGLTPDTEIDEVLKTIRALMNPKAENAVDEALRLGIISDTERPYYDQLSQRNGTEVIDLLTIRKRDHEKKENQKLGELFRLHTDQIISTFGADGWDNIRSLGYECARSIVENLPERITLKDLDKLSRQGKLSHKTDNEFTLEWYRKNNPKALENDPHLLEQLMQEKEMRKKYNRK